MLTKKLNFCNFDASIVKKKKKKKKKKKFTHNNHPAYQSKLSLKRLR